MDPTIRRVLTEPAIQADAARRVSARRERGGKDEQRFSDTLDSAASRGGESEREPSSDDQSKRPPILHSPPDDEVGSRLDISG